MQADDAISLLIFAFEKEEEDMLFLRWIQEAQHIMTLDDFRAALQSSGKRINERAAVKDALGIIEAMREKDGNI